MIQNVLMLLSPSCEPPLIAREPAVPARSMATMTARSIKRRWRRQTGHAFAVAGNAVGLMLFLTGIGLVLRLAEVLLH